ncbi:PDZ domain-containing protein [Rhodococcus sp. D2-41]|uniref:S1C family serine protease n=1 Tax=Speluncibacter jeojiensis TaxID=2710754 RepID=A0A9X4M4R1_9ACTN|nr:trypsin-like peptidase domain-containing protein [Rhodococcus sp. D2-41]MDG3009398.1 PDZ domain-containing protein [Rhodococcus sp. D2-41]MDG3016975.1 S1C family serine protease [Corynebacteriales bacterium D3-21]
MNRSVGTGGRHAHHRTGLSTAITALLIALAVVAGMAVGGQFWRTVQVWSVTDRSGGPVAAAPPDPALGSGFPAARTELAGNVNGLTNAVAPSVVEIVSTMGDSGMMGAGTGMVLTADGNVLTNNHVISGSTSLTVTSLATGRSYQGVVVGYDRNHDVAVVHMQGAAGLAPANLGDSGTVAVGDPVVALGNAGGQGRLISAPGQVTALDQTITASSEADGTSETLTGMIEINADVQPGDSGGPLIDNAGRVVGMNTAAAEGFSIIATGNRAYAIPINNAVATARNIEAGLGSADVHIGETAALGVLVSRTGRPSLGPLQLPGPVGPQISGVKVSDVVAGGPAQQAGLAAGDTITSVNGTRVGNLGELSAVVQGFHPGDHVQVGWTDQTGAAHTADVVLEAGPAA